jgi:hypothetical protein
MNILKKKKKEKKRGHVMPEQKSKKDRQTMG